MGVLDLDELRRTRSRGQVDDQTGRLLLGRTHRAGEH